jgi:hypothetical protein
MKLRDIARLVRSKNAGPFWITFDILFATDADYDRVANAQVITASWVAKTYGVQEADIILALHKPARAIKFSFPRPLAQGNPGETDMYAGQQYAPVLELEVD